MATDETATEISPAYNPPPELERLEQWQRHVHWFAIAALWVGAAVAGVILWHVAAPPAFHFLPAEQLRELRSMALTAVVTTSVTSYFQRRNPPRSTRRG